MNNQQENAANSLEGLTLENNWKVVRKIEPKEGATGGFFSVCYIVNNGEIDAFLKALNFQAFFQIFKGKSILEILSEQTNAFKFEKELLLKCKNNKLTKVSLVIDEGEVNLDNFTIPTVPYLIFEMAEGDVRSHMDFSEKIEYSWRLKSLHNVAVGLKQLHSIEIAHQDLKPSNVLLYENGLTSKIGDLGRSLCATIAAPHEGEGSFTGDFNYAPPEYLYKYLIQDWNFRVRSTDMYLFGSLIVFYFTGANMTALIGKNLDMSFRWGKWQGSFIEVQDYLTDAYYKALQEFKSNISNEKLAIELYDLVEYCCNPIPEKRGHPKSLNQALDRFGNLKDYSNQFDFNRIVTKLDLLSRKTQSQFYK